MMMKRNDPGVNPMMYFDMALECQRADLLTVMADAVSESRTAADHVTPLSEDGKAGLVRLTEIWCAMNHICGSVMFKGSPAEMLASVVAQVYAYLLQNPFDDPVGLALYVELQCMMASLMLGEWYE